MRVRAVLAAGLAPCMAAAHGFDERYDLPVPLSYFVVGAAAVVALSFVVAALFTRHAPAATRAPESGVTLYLGRTLPVLRRTCQVIALALFAMTMVAAWWGTGDPLMNLAPTLVWIIWWVGLSLLVACVGNVWTAMDPWRAVFEGLDALARRLGRPKGISFAWPWPRALGAWPAVALLLAWSWLEVVYPLASVPYRVGCAALLWSMLTLVGMVCFGREAWQQNADVFAIYFATLARMAPLATGEQGRSLVIRAPGAGLVAMSEMPAGRIGFVIAMLSTVLFDGLHGGQAWLLFEQTLRHWVPQWLDVNGYFAGTVGLIGVWLVFFVAYQATSLVTARSVGDAPAQRIASRWVLTLVPIAVAYNIAHNFSSLLIQGQNVIPLLSDPLGRGWDLFGAAGRYPNIGLIDAQVTWYVAIGAIVLGHVAAVWLAHRVALRECGTPRQAVLASIPLTVLMVAYTAISLLVIAEPMVTFESPVVASKNL